MADSPFGPWVVADYVPPEIYSMPPSCPLYHDRYGRKPRARDAAAGASAGGFGGRGGGGFRR